jgi:[NiFe] hydrogenase diaphorase moiety large subunit
MPCDMAGKDAVARQLENDLGIAFGETTPDRQFTLEWANCLGMCDQGPALLVNDRVYTRVTPEQVHDILMDCRRRYSPHGTARKEGVLV